MLDDVRQAEFLNSFIKEMMAWPTEHTRNMQLFAISDKLSDDAKRLLPVLGMEDSDD